MGCFDHQSYDYENQEGSGFLGKHKTPADPTPKTSVRVGPTVSAVSSWCEWMLPWWAVNALKFLQAKTWPYWKSGLGIWKKCRALCWLVVWTPIHSKHQYGVPGAFNISIKISKISKQNKKCIDSAPSLTCLEKIYLWWEEKLHQSIWCLLCIGVQTTSQQNDLQMEKGERYCYISRKVLGPIFCWMVFIYIYKYIYSYTNIFICVCICIYLHM